jgi:uncharacterized protein (UPF0333 family)
MSRRAQTTVEYMLVIAVLVIAIVATGFMLAPQFQHSMARLGDRAETVYTDGSITE